MTTSNITLLIPSGRVKDMSQFIRTEASEASSIKSSQNRKAVGRSLRVLKQYF